MTCTSCGATSRATIESRVPDKATPIVVYCASGVRSVFAAKTLTELGYEDVASMAGGFNKWKDESREWSAPRSLTAEQRNRYQRHLLLPEVDIAGQQKLLDSRVLLLGAGGLGSPAALYLAAAGVGTIGIIDMDVVDESNLQRQILHNIERVGDRKVDSAKKTLTLLNPDVDVGRLRRAPGRRQRHGHPPGLGRDRRRHRQLPDALPRERRVGEARHPRGARLDLPVRGHGHRVRPPARPHLPRHGAGAAARGDGAELRRGRCARRAARIIGSIQAIETIKLLLDLGDPLIGRLLAYDSLEQSFREYKVRVDPTNEITYENRDRIVVAELTNTPPPLGSPPPG